jgi:hypothetical protein
MSSEEGFLGPNGENREEAAYKWLVRPHQPFVRVLWMSCGPSGGLGGKKFWRISERWVAVWESVH